jgi:hypothetical protein
MTAFGLLHGIHGKKPDAIGHIPQMLIAGLGDRFDGLRGRGVSHEWSFLFQEIERRGGGWQRLRGSPTRQALRLVCFAVALLPAFKAGGMDRSATDAGRVIVGRCILPNAWPSGLDEGVVSLAGHPFDRGRTATYSRAIGPTAIQFRRTLT